MDGKRCRALLDAARAARDSGNFSAAIASYLEALRIITPDDSQIEFAMAVQQLGASALVEAPDLDIIDSSIRSELVSLYRSQGEAKNARHHAEIAWYLDTVVHGEEHNNTSASYHDLALVHLDLGNPDEAMKCFRKSEAIDQTAPVAQSAPKEIAWRAIMRGSILANYGYVEQAARYAVQTMDRLLQLFPTDPVKLVRAYDRGCQSLQNLGEHALARPYYEEAVKLARSHDMPVGLRFILLTNLVMLLEEQGDFGAASARAKELNDLSKGNRECSASILEQTQLIDRWRERSATIAVRAPQPWHDLFISYSTKQDDLIRRLHVELERRGITAWTFRESDDWRTERSNDEILNRMRAEIERSGMLLAVSSSTSLTSRFVAAELDHAIAKDVPVLMWYPEGVRLQPEVASTWSATSPDDLRAFTLRLSRPGVFSYYGYGLRDQGVSVIADAIVKRFTMIYPSHRSAASHSATRCVREGLDPTRLWPVVIDSEGTPLIPELMLAATAGAATWQQVLLQMRERRANSNRE